MCCIQDMCPPISQSPHPKIKPTTPLSVNKVFIIIMTQSLHLPHIPIQRRRNAFWIWKTFDISIPSMPTSCKIHMCIYACHVFDDTGFLPAFELKIVGFRMSLIAHLSNYFIKFLSLLHHKLCFPKCTRHRFFNV
ncbi:hypothetical protein D3C86_1702530 [compost metagenome]